MKTKLELAHDWAMKHGQTKTVQDRSNTVANAWDYADAMYAEADERENADRQDLTDFIVDSMHGFHGMGN